MLDFSKCTSDVVARLNVFESHVSLCAKKDEESVIYVEGLDGK